MATAKEIWDTLSKIDVSKHIEKKGNLSYLSWAWAWGELMNNYPEARYSFHGFKDAAGTARDVLYYPDGSAAVECTITIGDVSHTMWLPVMDNRNNAITDPNARQISDTKMRCLVKCIAMFGLGHYIYAGEDLPGNGETEQESPKRKTAHSLKKDGAWEEMVAKIDTATDETHLDLIAAEIRPLIGDWPKAWQENLKEYREKKRAEFQLDNPLMAG